MENLQTVNENKPHSSTTGKRKKVFILIAIAVIVVIIAAIVVIKNVPITDTQKDKKIWAVYYENGYGDAADLAIKYYGRSNENKAIAWLSVLSDKKNEKLAKDVTVIDQNLSVTSTGNYYDYEATVQNNSDESLSYIEINIYLMDVNDNIIYTDWTNWSGDLPPGATTVLDTVIPYQSGTVSYKVSIADVS